MDNNKYYLYNYHSIKTFPNSNINWSYYWQQRTKENELKFIFEFQLLFIRIIAFSTYIQNYTKNHIYRACVKISYFVLINAWPEFRLSLTLDLQQWEKNDQANRRYIMDWRVTRNRRFTVSLHTYTSAHTLTWNYVKCRLWASDHPSHALFFSSTRSRLLQPYFSPIFVSVALSPPNHFHFSVFFYSTVFQAFELTVFRNTRVIYDSYCSHDY